MDDERRRPWAGNRLLGSMTAADAEVLRALLEPVALVRDVTLIEPDEPASHVWFPDRGLLSVVALEQDGAAIEVATVGRSNMTGAAIVLGGESTIFRTMVQVAGEGRRIGAAAFRRVLQERPTFQQLMLRSVQASMTLMGQNAACNHVHGLQQRCARWLLLAHDDAGGDTFDLTQKYLGMMLAASRPSVSGCQVALQKAGLIRYTRGRITVLDRSGLEAQSCRCYPRIQNEVDRLFDA